MMRGISQTLEDLILAGLPIVGYEEDPPPEGNEGEEESEDDEEESEEEEEEDESEDSTEKETEKLRQTLRLERRQRQKLERVNKKLLKTQSTAETKDKTKVEEAQEKAAAQEAKVTKLATKLAKQAVDSAIIKHGSKLRFRDIDDALSLVDRELIDVDQDEDEPENVEIDEASVLDALKKLAKKKPHLLLAEGDEEPSGGNLGRGSTKDKDELDDEALRKKYPALRR